MRRPQRAAALRVSFVLLLLTAHLLAAAPPASAARGEPRLRTLWEDWLVSVEHILKSDERAAFEALVDTQDRERFVRALWLDRGERIHRRWAENEAAAVALRSLSPERALAVRLAGKPREIERVPACDRELRPLEIWHYSGWTVAHQTGVRGADTAPEGETPGFNLVFVQSSTLDMRSFRWWHPALPVQDLSFATLDRTEADDNALTHLITRVNALRCLAPARAERILGLLETALSRNQLESRMPWPRTRQGSDDLSLSTRVKERHPGVELPGALRVDFPGRYGQATMVLAGQVELPAAVFQRTRSGRLFDRITLTGDIYRGSRLVDSFEIVHLVSGGLPRQNELALDFYRTLRPGSHELDLRVTNSGDLPLLRVRRPLEVPTLADTAPQPAGRLAGFAQLARSEVVLLTTFPTLELLPPVGRLGQRATLEAMTTGGPIRAVVFRPTDGGAEIRDSEPPWTTEVTLPVGSEESRWTAIALDAEGRELARDETRVRAAGQPFAVDFKVGNDTGPEDTAESGDLVATVSVPLERRAEVSRCFHRDALVEERSLRAHETEGGVLEVACPRPPDSSVTLTWVRLEVELDSGERAEDVAFFGRDAPERLEISLVELYVSVLDRHGAPVPGLTAADFQVLENGTPRPIARFGNPSDLPLAVALMMDTSSSMGRRLRVSSESAERFFESVVTERDQAALLLFNHDIRLPVPFTSDKNRLRYGTLGLRAWGATRLWDGVVWSLGSFDGTLGRRALVVLTDGNDVGSDYDAALVADAARRASVALYPIALGDTDEATRAALADLARQTGGRSFKASSIAQLDRIYERIEEILRSQYLLVFEAEADGTSWRALEVSVTGEGRTASAVDGYFSR